MNKILDILAAMTEVAIFIAAAAAALVIVARMAT